MKLNCRKLWDELEKSRARKFKLRLILKDESSSPPVNQATTVMVKSVIQIKILKDLIQNRIKETGPISFAEFMKIVLYHPEWGYYCKKNQSDDYYTNVDVNPVFAKVLAQYFVKEWRKNFSPEKKFILVELGCGTGKLAQGILQWVQDNDKKFYEVLEYVGVEESLVRRNNLARLNKKFENKVRPEKKFDFPEKSIEGIVFSNEFFDALPFHRVINKKGEILEIYIDDSLEEIVQKPSEEVQSYLSWLDIRVPEKCIAEMHVESKKWMEKIGKALRKGVVLTIDYGFESEELYSDQRPEGTALCHLQHQTNKNFYKNLGLQDITAHINFTTLIKEGEKWGLSSSPLQTQSKFLLENGLEFMMKEIQSSKDSKAQLKNSSAVKSLIHQEGMGGIFKVLIQNKGILS